MNPYATLLLAPLLSIGLAAADADYATQQQSADKAFNELEGKPATDERDLELQKKELEIERLKLELERQKLEKERRTVQEPIPTPPPARQTTRPSAHSSDAGLYIGFESYSASGTRTNKYTSSSGYTAETMADIDYAQHAVKLGFGQLGENRLSIDFASGKDITFSDSGNSLYKEGTGVGLTWDIVMSSLYNASSSSNLLPFLRLGFGVGTYEYLDEYKLFYAEDTATAVEVKIGLGIYYQINRTFELAASYDTQSAALAYQNSSGDKWEISDRVAGVAVGLNIHF